MKQKVVKNQLVLVINANFKGEMNTLKVKILNDKVPYVKKAHDTDSGIDLFCVGIKQKTEDVFFFETGIAVEPPAGYYTEVVPRSSIYKTRWMMANSIGIIDQDYRGQIFVPMRLIPSCFDIEEEKLDKENLFYGFQRKHSFKIKEEIIGTRFAQLIFRKIEPCNIEIVDELNETVRGEGGFGSTNKK